MAFTFLLWSSKHNGTTAANNPFIKTDYITSGSTLPPYLAYPRFLLGMDLRLSTKEIYVILLDMTINGDASVDKHGRCYLTFINPEIANLIDRTPATVRSWRLLGW